MFLDRIRITKEQEVAKLASSFSLQEAEREIASLPPCRGFEQALSLRRKRAMGLIAEVKKASPSKGLIRADFDPISIAKAYEAAGTDCISVLTDHDYFQGSNEFLIAVRQEVEVPILRKDFTIDYRQIYEARLIGADAVLLIAAMLSAVQLETLIGVSRDLGLDALVEIHNREELERVLELKAEPKLIGINNRNLQTFTTDLTTSEELAELIPADCTVISESGIASVEDVEYLSRCGARAILVGEYFMRQPDVEQAVIKLLGPVAAARGLEL